MSGSARRRVDVVLSIMLWVTVFLLAVGVLLAVLVPYYSFGGHFPSTPPGTMPDRPDEVASIMLFKGTIWEGSFFRNLFWNVACASWCLWIPLLLLLVAKSTNLWRFQAKTRRRRVGITLGMLALFTAAWLVASYSLVFEYLD